MAPTSHNTMSTMRKLRALCIAISLASALHAQPADLAKRVAEAETAAMEARSHYAYRQTVLIEEMASKGGPPGRYKEVREVIFSPAGKRTERMVGSPLMALVRLRLTEEDFRDIREVQPFLFTADQLWLYERKPRGEETVDGIDCWLLAVRPRQTHQGMRLFDGMLWIDKRDYGVVRSQGQAVPQILSTKEENLFPRFTTFREKIDGQHWFPVHTHSDDTLQFSSGAIRQRMSIRYEQYQKFSADSKISFR